MVKSNEVECPECSSKACYKYGHSKQGKKRFKCIVCDRQFVLASKNRINSGKLECVVCGNKMYLYKIEDNTVRFRCSMYPECKFYKKYILLEVE